MMVKENCFFSRKTCFRLTKKYPLKKMYNFSCEGCTEQGNKCRLNKIYKN